MQTPLDRLVQQRANQCCEYCLLPDLVLSETFQLDHIIAKQHGGLTQEENLAYCCPGCNRNKGPNIAGLDPDRAERVAILLFDPAETFGKNISPFKNRTS